MKAERYTEQEVANVCQKCGGVRDSAKYRMYKINHKVAMSGNFCLGGLSLIYERLVCGADAGDEK